MALLEDLSSHDFLVHLYEWQGDCATYGHFVDPQQYFRLNIAKEMGLSLARRPTGGGMIFHSYDYAFSVLIGREHEAYRSNTLESYALVNQWTSALIEMVFHVKPEITIHGCGITSPTFGALLHGQANQI